MAIGSSFGSTITYGATAIINEFTNLIQDGRKGFHLATDYFEKTQDKRVALANSEMEDQMHESHDQVVENKLMRLSRLGDKMPHLQEAIKNAQNSIVKKEWNLEPVAKEVTVNNNNNNQNG